MRLTTACTFLLVGLGANAYAADSSRLAACDKDEDGRLSESEFRDCLLALDPILSEMAKDDVSPKAKAQVEAADLAADAMTTAPTQQSANGEDSVSMAAAEQYLKQRAANTRQPGDLKLGWKSLRIGRKLTDAVDPRKKNYPAAFVLSYTDDRVGKDDSFVALGDITWWSRPLSSLSRVDFKSSVDVATSKAPSESSIDLAVPLSRVWTFESRWLSSLGASIEPKYTTDRDFRRDVVQITAVVAPSSINFLRAGYNTTLGKPGVGYVNNFEFYWQPSLGIEYGKVNDAGGNAALALIEASGEFKRVAASAEFKLLWPRRIPLSFNAAYTERLDLDEDWKRGFFTTGLQYDVAKNFSLTLTYRKGRKPDTFEKVDDLLLGIGLTKAE